MKIYYWSPHLSKVGTIKSVYNSCKSLRNKGIDAKIINEYLFQNITESNMVTSENTGFRTRFQKPDDHQTCQFSPDSYEA